MTSIDNNIMVLGANGMLGSMVFHYLSAQQDFKVSTNKHRWPSNAFMEEVKNFSGIIVNCIGGIPQSGTSNFEINHTLPVFLLSTKNKLVQPCTDCVYDGKLPTGYCYTGVNNFNANDDYGLSKRRFAEQAESYGNKLKIIRCSIIGYDKNNVSLMSWLIEKAKTDKSCDGYVNHLWNGVTTLTWAKVLVNVITNWDKSPMVTIPGIEPMNKYELLCTINETHELAVSITPVKNKYRTNKCLSANIKCDPIRDQLCEMAALRESL